MPRSLAGGLRDGLPWLGSEALGWQDPARELSQSFAGQAGSA